MISKDKDRGKGYKAVVALLWILTDFNIQSVDKWYEQDTFPVLSFIKRMTGR